MTLNANFFSSSLEQADKDLFNSISQELSRQQNQIELIASENIVSKAVLEAQGSIMTNKYAEGYSAKRYYGGCEFVDIAENLAIERLKELYGCAYANVQPHSGAQANQAVFLALIKPGDTILGMSLDAGGHLTHGSRPNQSGKYFNAIQYGIDPTTSLIDYDEVEKLALEHKPSLIIAGGSAYPRNIDFKRFREIADKVEAYLLVDMAHYSGLVAAKEYPDPVPHAHVVTSTTHKTIRGPRGGMILSNDIDLGKLLYANMVKAYKIGLAQSKKGHFSTQDQMTEFWLDGKHILEYLTKKRGGFFSTKTMMLAGVETLLYQDLRPSVKFKGSIDLVFYHPNTDRWTVMDIKTSTRGWNKDQKKNPKLTAQVVLYKEFFSKQFGVDKDKIDVEYFIVKRRIPVEAEFASMQKRVQTFSPPSGPRKTKEVISAMNLFMDEVLDKDANYIDKEYSCNNPFGKCNECSRILTN